MTGGTVVDVVVVGAGLAGTAAALAAAEQGAEVCLLEKAGEYGGSSVRAGGAMVFAGTDLQRAAGVEDDGTRLRQTLLDVGGHANDPATVDAYVANQLATYTWLRHHGVEFDYAADLQPGQVNRIHGTVPGHATATLHTHVRSHPSVQLRTSSRATRLVRGPDGRVAGVVVEEETVTARRGVVLATGGFTRSDRLVRTFAPQWQDAVRMGGAANTGDGLLMAWQLGAGLADMAYVEASFGASAPHYPDLADRPGEDPSLLYATTAGAIIVNRDGRRFVNEAWNYKQISRVCAEQPDGVAFQVFDADVMARSRPTPSPADFRSALADGRVRQAATIEELADVVGIDPGGLRAGVETYNRQLDDGSDPDFGRPLVDRGPGGSRIDRAPFYAYPCRNGLTTTYCGLTVDRTLRVLDVLGDPITGLYAAGEVVGGFHGAAYYSGSALGKAAVFGRVAGVEAART